MVQPQNTLIGLLQPALRRQLLARCEPVRLVPAQILCHTLLPLSHAYFPVHGAVTLAIEVDDQPALQVGMIGREGMLGCEWMIGLQVMPWRLVSQGEGSGWRIDSESFLGFVAKFPALEAVCRRYLMVRLQQLSRAAACQRFHPLGPRLACWLLMSQDRAHANAFPVTQVVLALLLGVRRVGITQAANTLRQQGLSAYHRGTLTILTRQALEQLACSCHAADLGTYERLMRATDTGTGSGRQPGSARLPH